MGHEYVAEVEKHSSQTDAAKGFGGKYGVEKDRADKVSLSLCYPAQIMWDLPTLTIEVGSTLLLWKDRAVDSEGSFMRIATINFLSKFLGATWRGHMLS